MSVLQITKSMIVLILSSELSPLAGMRVRKILGIAVSPTFGQDLLMVRGYVVGKFSQISTQLK